MDNQLKSKIDTAKAYKKHGLYGESIAVYTAIVETYSDLDEEVSTLIQAELDELRVKWEQILATLPIDEGLPYVDSMWAEIEAGVLR